MKEGFVLHLCWQNSNQIFTAKWKWFSYLPIEKWSVHNVNFCWWLVSNLGPLRIHMFSVVLIWKKISKTRSYDLYTRLIESLPVQVLNNVGKTLNEFDKTLSITDYYFFKNLNTIYFNICYYLEYLEYQCETLAVVFDAVLFPRQDSYISLRRNIITWACICPKEKRLSCLMFN